MDLSCDNKDTTTNNTRIYQGFGLSKDNSPTPSLSVYIDIYVLYKD